MNRILTISILAVSLGGCATIGKAPAPMPAPVVRHLPFKPRYPIIEKKPLIAPTPVPEQPTFKKRWYSRFKVHPKWFHD